MFGLWFTVSHDLPASSLRQSSESSFVSLIMQTIFGSLGVTATPMRSIAVRGSPRRISGPEGHSQVVPPFTDFQTDVLPLPDSRCQADCCRPAEDHRCHAACAEGGGAG